MRESAIIDTYLDQVLTSPGGRPLPASVGHVFGTAIPQGPTDWDELHRVEDFWLTAMAKLGVDASPGYAIGAIRSWVEPVIFAAGLSDHNAAVVASDCRLEFYLALREGTVEVLDRWGRFCGRGPLRVPDATGVCVMPNTEPGEVCVMRGGPYSSRAIAASLDWKWERQRLVAALGCQTCRQGELYRMRALGAEGKVFTGGGPITLVPHEAPTRFTTMMEVSHG